MPSSHPHFLYLLKRYNWLGIERREENRATELGSVDRRTIPFCRLGRLYFYFGQSPK
jgi:hypothetical protein